MHQKILVIDDEVDMLMLLKIIIEDNTDYEVETTNSPAEGIKLFKEKDFDLVISDFKMPGLDGMELFDEFMKRKPWVPVIIITAYGASGTAEEALKKGVADFITKPFRKDTILFTMRRLLELSLLKRENMELRGRIGEKPLGK